MNECEYVYLYLALIAQIKMNPSSWSVPIGMFWIFSSESESYAIATPREGCDEESCQGGSIMITSNIRPQCLI